MHFVSYLRGYEKALWLATFIAISGSADAQPSFVVGMDVSFLDQLEEHGAVYTEDGEAVDLLVLLQRHGVNTVRLRLWHTPADGYNNLDRTLQMAQRIQDTGMELFLDFHYSDSWADPGKQYKPTAWEDLSFDVLQDSVQAYTARVIGALKAQGTLPSMVQIGNEVTVGMLWDDGRIGGSYDTPAQWQRFAALLHAGIAGVRAPLDEGDDVQIVIHIDRGGDAAGARWFFDNLRDEGVDFDIIGLSFYPWWHGTLNDLHQTLNLLAQRYGKPLLLAEVAYPWTLQWFDATNNIVGSTDGLLDGYPATPEGQRDFLRAVFAVVQDAPDGLGRGVVYWAPEWIPTDGFGSAWENLALFDPEGEVLPAIEAFEEASPSDRERPHVPQEEAVEARPSNVPNPFAQTTRIRYYLPEPSSVTLTVYDILGREVASLQDGAFLTSGWHEVAFDGTGLPHGVYLYTVQTPQQAIGRGRMVLQR